MEDEKCERIEIHVFSTHRYIVSELICIHIQHFVKNKSSPDDRIQYGFCMQRNRSEIYSHKNRHTRF